MVCVLKGDSTRWLQEGEARGRDKAACDSQESRGKGHAWAVAGGHTQNA